MLLGHLLGNINSSSSSVSTVTTSFVLLVVHSHLFTPILFLIFSIFFAPMSTTFAAAATTSPRSPSSSLSFVSPSSGRSRGQLPPAESATETDILYEHYDSYNAGVGDIAEDDARSEEDPPPMLQSASQQLENPPADSAAELSGIGNYSSITTPSKCYIDSSDLSYSCRNPKAKTRKMTVDESPGPPLMRCPPSCQETKNSSSCINYIDEQWEQICDVSSYDWSSLRLKYCCEHSIRDTVRSRQWLSNKLLCRQHMFALRNLENFIMKVTCQFEEIINRYDCNQNYTATGCNHCKESYRRWVCASLIPHWIGRRRVKPCRSVCHLVEESCPFFLPADKVPGYVAQYSGEPLFQCIDPNIPETGEQLLRSLYGTRSDECCFEYCYNLFNSFSFGKYGIQEKPNVAEPCIRSADKSANGYSRRCGRRDKKTGVAKEKDVLESEVEPEKVEEKPGEEEEVNEEYTAAEGDTEEAVVDTKELALCQENGLKTDYKIVSSTSNPQQPPSPGTSQSCTSITTTSKAVGTKTWTLLPFELNLMQTLAYCWLLLR